MSTSRKVEPTQNCAEQMLSKAAELMLQEKRVFAYSKPFPDTQVDISPALSEVDKTHKGDTQANLEKAFKSLDPNKAYFLRTGITGESGHWQLLYFDEKKEGWIRYSSEKSKPQVTQNGVLTEEGKQLLTLHAKKGWGEDHGQWIYLIAPASRKNIINGANYLYDSRMLGEVEAEIKSMETEAYKSDEPVFYPQIQAQQAPKPQDAPQPPKLPKPPRRELSAEQDIHQPKREKSPFEIDFERELKLLKAKTASLAKQPKFVKAHRVAHQLCLDLEAEGQRYFEGKQTEASYNTFKTNCENHIKTALPRLDRGCGLFQILINILAIIFTAGVGYAVAAAINVGMHGRLTFFDGGPLVETKAIKESVHRASKSRRQA